MKFALDSGTKVFFGETGVVLPTGKFSNEEIFYRSPTRFVSNARRVELATVASSMSMSRSAR